MNTYISMSYTTSQAAVSQPRHATLNLHLGNRPLSKTHSPASITLLILPIFITRCSSTLEPSQPVQEPLRRSTDVEEIPRILSARIQTEVVQVGKHIRLRIVSTYRRHRSEEVFEGVHRVCLSCRRRCRCAGEPRSNHLLLLLLLLLMIANGSAGRCITMTMELPHRVIVETRDVHTARCRRGE